MTDYYAILGVSRNATANEIRDAYLQLARETHPDKVKDPIARKKAEDVFKNVTAAYDTLSRDRSRKEYTAKLPSVSETRPPSNASKTMPPSVSGPPLAEPKAPLTNASAGGSTALPTSGRSNFDALGQGIEAFKKQDFHTAVQLLNVAVTNDEKNPKAQAMLAMALAKNPNWVRTAVHHLETAARLEPKNVSYQAELALMLQSQGLKLRARRALDTAIALNPEHPDVVRAMKEIPVAAQESETPSRATGETSKGLLDRLLKR